MQRAGFLGHADDGCGRAVALGAAALAAGTGDTVHLDDQMAQLTGRAVRAGPDFAVHNDARAHARAQGEENGGAGIAAYARLILGPASHRRVVIDEDGQVVVGFQLLAQGNVAPAEIGAEDDAAGFLLGNAGNTDADGGDILRGQLRLVQELGDACGHIAHNVGVGTLGQGRGFGLAQDLAILADQADGDVGAAQIDADVVHNQSLLCNG